MKSLKFVSTLFIALFFALALPLSSIALPVNSASPLAVRDSAQDARVLSRIVLRVNEIQNMDKSTLNSAEKKSVRKELNSLRKEAKSLSSGVYVSVGAIIIGILLLILLLK